MKNILPLTAAMTFALAGVAIGDSTNKADTKLSPIIAAIDSMNPDEFAKLVTDDASFVFGNFPAAVGKEAIRQAQADFFASIKDMRHEILYAWEDDNSIVAEMKVTYTRLDGSSVSLPVTDVFRLEEGKVASLAVYMDIAPLYQK